MLGKVWKKVLLFILIIACLFDVTIKLTKRNSFKNEIKATIDYFSNNDEVQSSTENSDTVMKSNNGNATNNENAAIVIDANNTINNVINKNEKNINDAINLNSNPSATIQENSSDNNYGTIKININE